jgi:hypothetical protein
MVSNTSNKFKGNVDIWMEKIPYDDFTSGYGMKILDVH